MLALMLGLILATLRAATSRPVLRDSRFFAETRACALRGEALRVPVLRRRFAGRFFAPKCLFMMQL